MKALHSKLLVVLTILLLSFSNLVLAQVGTSKTNAITISTTAGGTINFNDSRSNAIGFVNNYGNSSPDIWYTFTIDETASIKLSLCDSNFDTYLYLLDQNLSEISSNDDHGPLCEGSQSSIEQTVTAGTYYIVVEGYDNFTGNVVASFQIKLPEIVIDNCEPLAATLSQDQNYIAVYTPQVPIKNEASLITTSVCGVQQTVQYLDGLGRAIQTVQTKAGANKDMDIVLPIAYDALGREKFKYLPYASPSSNGSYKPFALTEIGTYYQSKPTGQAVAFNTPFAESRFEKSSKGRIVEQGSEGSSWQLSAGHTLKTNYLYNNTDVDYATTGFAVRRFKAIPVAQSGLGYQRILSGVGYYPANELHLTIHKNENWISADGKVGTTEIYNDKEGKLILKRSFNKNDLGSVETISTYYVYDDFGNLSFVLPSGTDPDNTTLPDQTALNNYAYQYYFDARGRLIEKKLPGVGWEYYVYNIQDQLVLSQDANLRANNNWLYTKYDGMGRIIIKGVYSSAANRSSVQFSVDINYPIAETRNGSSDYTNVAFPITSANPQIINYYDDYTFPEGTTYAYSSASKLTKGLLTGSKIKVIGTPVMLLSINFYDETGRLAKLYKQHYFSSAQNSANYDEITYNYNFLDAPVLVSKVHHIGSIATTINIKYEYDHMGRLLQTKERINNGAEIVLNKMNYNDLGQLVKKSLHSIDGNTFSQSTDFTYNERGWLKEAISPEFSFKLKFDEGQQPQYNGNIAYQEWGTGASFPNTFTYTYDKIDRLIDARSTGIVMKEVVTYHPTGNIKTLNRDESGAGIYNYVNGNQLNSISGGGLAAGNYNYDPNGNATIDGRNNIGFTYNYLNLPVTANSGNVNLTYIYDATGKKLRKVSTGSITTTTDYIDGIQYLNGSIDFIQTDEGFARNSGGNYSYEYFLVDHLGNVRTSFDIYGGAVRVLQRDDFYAFGLRKAEFGGLNKYLYNGKELQEELEQYDYGARFYDPVIGRWNVVDPLAEKSRRFSPYVYGNNNPIRFIDPDGMETDDWGKKGNIWSWDDNIKSPEQAKAAGYDDYRAPGSIVTNTKLGEDGKPGNIYLGENSSDAYYVLNTVDIRPELKMGIGETQGALGAAVPLALTSSAIDGPLPIGEAIGVGIITAAAVHDAMTKVYITYTLTGPAGQVYVGRSSGFGDPQSIMMNRYGGHHMRAFGYGNPQLDRTAVGYPAGYYAIRGREQDVVTALGGIGSSRVGNRINPIWEYNPNRPIYLGASKLMFGPIP